MIVELKLGHCRPLLAEELHAIVRQPLLDLGNMCTVARLHCAEHVNSRQIQAREGPVVHDLRYIGSGGGGTRRSFKRCSAETRHGVPAAEVRRR